jgi:hypothetical protein
LRSPIVLWSPDPANEKLYLLDGRSRLDAMETIGVEVLQVGWHGGGIHQLADNVHYRVLNGVGGQSLIDGASVKADPYEFVISANIRRRHLTTEQKRVLIVKLLKLDTGKSDRQIAKTVQASPTTVGTIRKKLETKGDVSKLDTRSDTKGRQQQARKPKLHRGEILRGGRSASANFVAGMEEADPENGRAKALAVRAGVPFNAAFNATRQTAGVLIGAALTDVEASANARKAEAEIEEAPLGGDPAEAEAATVLIEVQRGVALLNQKTAWPPLSKHGERQRDKLMEALIVITAKLSAILDGTSKQKAAARLRAKEVADAADFPDMPAFLRRDGAAP